MYVLHSDKWCFLAFSNKVQGWDQSIFYIWISNCYQIFSEKTVICPFNCLYTSARKSMSHIFGGLFLFSWFCSIDLSLYQIYSLDCCSTDWALTSNSVIPSSSILFALSFPFCLFTFSYKFEIELIPLTTNSYPITAWICRSTWRLLTLIMPNLPMSLFSIFKTF